MGSKRSKRRKTSDHHSKNSEMLLSKQTWKALFFLRPTMSIPPTPAEKNQVKEEIRSSNIELHESKLIMGNREGISILERLDQLEKRLDQTQGYLATLGSMNETLGLMNEMYLIRAAVLDDWSSLSDRPTVVDRNITAHGGKVAMDATTIKHYSENAEDDNRFQKWKDSFHHYYGIAYSDDIVDKVNDFHPHFRTVLDRRASVMAMRHWTKKENAERKARIITNANKIIQEGHESGGNDIFQENSWAMEYYRQIEKDWCSAKL